MGIRKLIIILSCLGLGALLSSRMMTHNMPVEEVLAQNSAFRLAWPKGVSHRYSVSYTSDSGTLMMRPSADQVPKMLKGHFELDGTIELVSHGQVAGRTRLALRVLNMAHPTMVLLGTPIEGIEAQLTDGVALLDLDLRGHVITVSFGSSTTPIFESIAQLLISELQVSTPGNNSMTWTAVETTRHGQVTSNYEIDAMEGPIVLLRSRTEYQSLQALVRHDEWSAEVADQSTIRVQKDGPITSIHHEEIIQAQNLDGLALLNATATFQATLIETRRVKLAEITISKRITLGQQTVGPQDRLTQRIGGLTADQMLNTLANQGRFGKVPNHNRFLWQASGLLKAKPELCAQLVDLLRIPSMRTEGRMLLLDLLVGAGHSMAQTALRDALQSDVVQKDPQSSLMYQRLSMLPSPDLKTLTFAQQRMVSPGSEGYGAATYTMGAMVGHAAQDEDPELRTEGLRIAQEMADELTHLDPQQEERQLTLIEALGNAALPMHAEVIRSLSTHQRPLMRMGVASALRHMSDASSRQTLVELTTDDEVQVGRRALRSLGKQPLSGKTLKSLNSMVNEGRIDETNYHDLVGILTPYLSKSETVRITLEALLKQPMRDARVKSRIRSLLAG